MRDVEALAAASGEPLENVLAELEESGLVGVALAERTVGDLIDAQEASLTRGLGWATVLSAAVAIRPASGPPPIDVPATPAQGSPEFEVDRISRRLPMYGGSMDVGGSFGTLFRWKIPNYLKSQISNLPIGIDSRLSKAATEQGLVVIGRVNNHALLNERLLVSSLEDLKEQGIDSYLVGGNQVIGHRPLIETTREALEELGMHYLSPEFVTLGGDSYLRKNLAHRTIRLHSISQTEAQRMTPRALNERFAKAFRERNVRWLLLRPTTRASDDPLKQVGETLEDIRFAIIKAGGEVKEPRPFEDPGVPAWLIGLIGTLALPALVWACLQALGKGAAGQVAAVAVALLVGDVFFMEGATVLVALIIATAFPVVAYLHLLGTERISPIRDYTVVTLISLAGGLCVGGMLVGTEYMVRADVFRGVRFAIFAPMLVVGFLLLKRQGLIRDLLGKPITWGAAAVGLAGLVAVFVLAARTGNENPAAVSGIELQVRSLLDQLLFVRPRTKEVLLGHPALVLGLCLAAYRPHLRGWAALLLLAGVVGQTSVVNTLCHLHTPIALSLTRVLVGFVGGGIIGLLTWLVVKRWIPMKTTSG
ncbi:MAG: hypothetical protein IIC73_08370, partial [Armatimonadetes bacterium]|nr:hypothetical protein [Armatimonadota bacterium]